MPRERLPLVINGVDFSPCCERLGYQVSYEDRTGNNSMLALSGDEYMDVLTARPVISWTLNMLWSDELSALITAIRSAIYVPVYYYDPAQGAATIGYFHGTIGASKVGLIRSGQVAWQNGSVLTLRSR